MNRKSFILTIANFLFIFLITSVYSQEKMSIMTYDSKLAQWKQRQVTADSALKHCDEEIAALKAEIQKVGTEIKQTRQEIYKLIEANEIEIEEFRRKLEKLEQQVDELQKKTTKGNADLKKKINHDISSCWQNKISSMPDIHVKLSHLEKKMVFINLKMKKNSLKK